MFIFRPSLGIESIKINIPFPNSAYINKQHFTDWDRMILRYVLQEEYMLKIIFLKIQIIN